MNERYLFRGRRMRSGDWVTGYYVGDFFNDGGTYLLDKNDVSAVPVRPATIGQCTGLRDKNGKLIFEGDIISLTTADNEKITITCEFGKAVRQIFENEVEITCFYFVRSNDGRKTFPIIQNYLGKHDTEIWEIIGTIHDTPSPDKC